MAKVELEQPGQLQSPSQAPDLFLHRFVHLAGGLVDRGGDEVLQHLDVVPAHHLGVDRQALEVLLAVHDDLHHPPARRGLDLQRLELLLDALLGLLELFHELLWVAEWVHGLFSRTSTTLPPKRSSASWTAGSRAASSMSRRFFASPGVNSTGAVPGAEPTCTFNGRPAALRASSR